MYRSGIFSGRQGIIRAIMVLAAVALLAASLDQPAPDVVGAGRASDGDSFWLGGDRVRLLGLDAPELSQHCATAKGARWPCGHVARDRMAALLASGTISCQPQGHDRYARILARCSIQGQDLGATLVSEGLAISAGDYWGQEVAARKAGLGIWVGGFEKPADWRSDHPRPVGFLDWLGL